MTRFTTGWPVMSQTERMIESLTWEQHQTGLEYPEQLSQRATALADELLTPEWRTSLGSTWVLVWHLIAWRAEVGGDGLLFITLADLERRVGRDERTLQRWLSPEYRRHKVLSQWFRARRAYRSRDGRYVSRVGTVFEVKVKTLNLTRDPSGAS